MNPAALLAPLFLAFELWQLVVSERYMGIKDIWVNADPRELPMKDWMAATWAGGLLAYYIWMTTLLLHPVGAPKAPSSSSSPAWVTCSAAPAASSGCLWC